MCVCVHACEDVHAKSGQATEVLSAGHRGFLEAAMENYRRLRAAMDSDTLRAGPDAWRALFTLLLSVVVSLSQRLSQQVSRKLWVILRHGQS